MKKIICTILLLVSIAAYSAPILFEQGEKARNSGQMSKARQYYFKFFTRNPKSKYAPVAMYRYALSNIPYRNAVAYLNRILKKYPNYQNRYKIVDKIAMLHYLKEKYKQGIKTLNRIVTADDAKTSEKLRAYYYVGKCYLLLGRSTKANKFFKLVINAGKNAYKALAELEIAEIYFKNRDYRKAKQKYESVVRNYPESEVELKAVYRLGIIYTYNGDKEKAKAAYNYIIQSYPMSIEASFAKEKLKKITKNFASARRNIISNNYNPPSNREKDNENRTQENTENRGQTPLTQKNNEVRLTLHIGNYRIKHRGYAYHIYRKLKRSGFKAYIKKRKIKGRFYYTLRVGNFKSKRKAIRKALRIKRKFRLRVKVIDET